MRSCRGGAETTEKLLNHQRGLGGFGFSGDTKGLPSP